MKMNNSKLSEKSHTGKLDLLI